MPGLTTPITTTSSSTIETALVKNADGTAVSSPSYVDCTANGTAANGQKAWICAVAAPAGTYPAEAQRFRVKGSAAASDTALSTTAGVVVAGTTTPPPSTVSNTEKLFKAAGLASDSTRYFVGTPQETDGAELYAALLQLENAKKSAGITAAYQPAYYPCLGGTALAHSFNLMNPVDADAAYRAVFINSPTHGPLGVAYSAANQCSMNTFFRVNTLTTTAGHGIAVYAQQYIGNDQVLVGATWTDSGGNAATLDLIQTSGGIGFEDVRGSVFDIPNAFKGHLFGNRQSDDLIQLWAGNQLRKTLNGQAGTSQAELSAAPNTATIMPGGRGGVAFFTDAILSSKAINAKGMPNDMWLADTAAETQFQTRLGRNV